MITRLQALIRAFFGFSKVETNGFIILIPLILIILFSEPLYRNYFLQTSHYPGSEETRKLDSLLASLKWIESADSTGKPSVPPIRFHFFDPNTVAELEMVAMQLSPKMAARIQRYREKGGSFRKKEDVLKIYGMDTGWYNQAAPWIRISVKKDTMPHRSARVNKKQSIIVRTDINTADSLQLTDVQGIGPTLSVRIRTFRDRMGGFVTMSQLREVYGLDSTVVSRLEKSFFVAESFHPHQIDLNTATIEDLLRHPYIKRKEAQAIVSYRLQHGPFKSLAELGQIKLLNEEWITRVIPYLKIS